MLRLQLNGDERTESGTPATLVERDGSVKARGELRPSEGAEFLINNTPDGGEIDVALRFVGTVVNR